VRKEFCGALVRRAEHSDMVFLTGDLGFMALEPLQAVLGDRFINAGVAEQNMVSVSAALARQGFEVWAYSIAPFCYARPFEQIRNDITFHKLPVTLVGNGGGYGYGVMGPTHHAIEDYGVLLTLDGLVAFVPTFDQDVAAVVDLAGSADHPSYLRLGRGEPPEGYTVPPYAPWRILTQGGGPIVIVVGPIAGTYIAPFQEVPFDERPNLWTLAELPLERNPIPEPIVAAIANGAAVCVVEEHVSQGSFASAFVLNLTVRGIAPKLFRHLNATAHTFPRYGSQAYLRKQSGLGVEAVLGIVMSLQSASA
jgi:transketolase